jgi:hypothetical protein
MGLIESLRDFSPVSQCLIQRQRSPFQPPGQRLAVQQFHHEKVGLLMPANVSQVGGRTINMETGVRISVPNRGHGAISPDFISKPVSCGPASGYGKGRQIRLVFALLRLRCVGAFTAGRKDPRLGHRPIRQRQLPRRNIPGPALRRAIQTHPRAPGNSCPLAMRASSLIPLRRRHARNVFVPGVVAAHGFNVLGAFVPLSR